MLCMGNLQPKRTYGVSTALLRHQAIASATDSHSRLR